MVIWDKHKLAILEVKLRGFKRKRISIDIKIRLITLKINYPE